MQTMQTMQSKFISLLAKILDMDANEIGLQDKFREYENWDSLAYLSLIAMMDEEFDICIYANNFKPLITVEDLVHAVTKV